MHLLFHCIWLCCNSRRRGEKSKTVNVDCNHWFIVRHIYWYDISTVLTMTLPYFEENEASLPFIFKHFRMDWAFYVVSIGTVAGLCGSLMGTVVPFPHIIHAKASDELIFKWMGHVYQRFQTSMYGTLFVDALTGLMFQDLEHLVNTMSIGTLMAYTILPALVMLLRYEVTDVEYTIKNPSSGSQSILRIVWNSNRMQISSKPQPLSPWK